MTYPIYSSPLGEFMKNNRFPPITKELLDELEKRFPDLMPDFNDSIETIRFKQGQVSVIRFLRTTFDSQNRNILEK
jgi:hypothetical protein